MQLIFAFLIFYIEMAICKEKEDESTNKNPEISEQIDPSIYIRQAGLMQGMGFGQNAMGITQNSANSQNVNFAFTCKCNSKSTNPLGVAPIDANQLAQQQIAQLQEQVRRQQEIINRQGQNKNGFENFAQLIALANSMECSCSSEPSSTNFAPAMGVYGASGMGIGSGYPPITNMGQNTGFGFPTSQRGVPIANFGGVSQPMVEMPFSKF